VRRFGLRSLAGLVGLAWMAAPTFAQEQPPPSPPSEVVWRWFDECSPRQTIHLELLLDGESIYAATFPACAVSRDAPDSSARQKLTFSFLGRTDIFGEEHATRGTQRIEGILWKAGGDRDALLLGVVFLAGHEVLSSAIHVADPHKASQSSLGKGLSIETSSLQPR